jgi:hypothetical protein
VGHRGGAVQVDPIKPTSKSLGTKPLKLKHDELLSIFAFKFKLRRYMVERLLPEEAKRLRRENGDAAHTVGRCRLTLSNPC